MPKTPKRSFKKNIENTKVYYIEKNDDDSDIEDTGTVLIQLPTIVIDTKEEPEAFIEQIKNELVIIEDIKEKSIEELSNLKLKERQNEDKLIQKQIEELNNDDITNNIKKPYIPFNNKEFDNCLGLEPDHFYKNEYNLIYNAITTLINKNSNADILTVGQYLRDKNKLDEIGGGNLLLKIVDTAPLSMNVKAHAKIESWLIIVA